MTSMENGDHAPLGMKTSINAADDPTGKVAERAIAEFGRKLLSKGYSVQQVAEIIEGYLSRDGELTRDALQILDPSRTHDE